MEEILAHIKARTDEYVARLKRACAQPSISAQGAGVVEMADMVAAMLRDIGLGVDPQDLPRERWVGRNQFNFLLTLSF